MNFLKRIPAVFSIPMGLCLWYLCLMEAPVLKDPDTAWHLAAGDLLRTSGFTTSDPWSWTAAGKHWINIAWMFDVIISWLHAHTDFNLLYPLCLLIVSLLVTLQVIRARSLGAIVPVLAFIVPLLSTQVYSGTLLRPNLITLVFTFASYYLLASNNPKWRWRRYPALALITIVWVNMHGGYLYLFLLFGVFGLEALIQHDRDKLIELGALGMLCLMVTGINPYGYEIVRTTFAGMNTSFNALINEWKATNLRDNTNMLLVLALLMAGGGFSDKRIRIADRVLVFVLFYLTLTSQRHAIMLALFCIPYLGITLTNLIRSAPQLQWIETTWDRLQARIKAEDMRIVSLIMLAFVLVFVCSPWPRNVILKTPIDISHEQVAPEDLAYVQEHFAGKKIFNHYDLGGHLIYFGRGNPKLFIDGRSNTAYPEEVLIAYRDFMRFSGQDPLGVKVHEKYGFEAVLIPNNIEDKGFFDDNRYWKLDHEGKSFSIYVPK